jgi:hypothetical protein
MVGWVCPPGLCLIVVTVQQLSWPHLVSSSEFFVQFLPARRLVVSEINLALCLLQFDGASYPFVVISAMAFQPPRRLSAVDLLS